MRRGVPLPGGPRPGLDTELAEILGVVLVQHGGVALGSAAGGELVVEVLVASLGDVDSGKLSTSRRSGYGLGCEGNAPFSGLAPRKIHSGKLKPCWGADSCCHWQLGSYCSIH